MEGFDGHQRAGGRGTVVTQDRGDGNGQFADRPGARQVPEVDEAVGNSVWIAHHVIAGDVAVNDLHRQICGESIDDRPGPGGSRLKRLAKIAVLDMLSEQLHRAHAVPQIPLQYPVDAGVIEIRQRTSGPASQVTKGNQLGRAEVHLTAERSSIEVADHPGEQPAVDVDRGNRILAGELQIGGGSNVLGRADEGRRSVLGLELGQAENGVGDLEHTDRCFAVRFRDVLTQQVVDILLAAERGDGGVHAEKLGGDGAGLLVIHGRNR